MSSAERQSHQTRERKTQNRRSAAVSFGRFPAGALQDPDLMPQGDMFQLQRSAGAEHRTQRGKESGQQDQHRIDAIFSKRTEFPIGDKRRVPP
jgi:hypothetical protein